MNREPAPTLRLHLALILLSAALIAFQLEQMQLLALVQWHHFAYLIISVALLGFGAGGTFIALCRTILLRHLDWLLPLLPKATHYCEPFGGSAAVLLNREPAPVETFNYIDG